ncbi:gamma-glutamylcyclotransferase [Granulicella sp. 5B5]|uniref:gamma-glutamylcyclotransferase family protein n=1 Tax=Granulicella sp. 5B5 TaxID=1617967 RepID=UPI0015F7521B|nr:gamma-glutamylcyclotransferase family protein [Granulicella sp. 5B5]QMV18963.1 gamma-glutamylcyclotransferase [Granulicella sp. 5B5]
MDELLFVYGTLHPERAPREIAEVARRLRLVGVGWVRGRRFELGPYPGVVLDESSRAEGAVFALPDDAETLAMLDAYEDYRADDPVGSLFRRVETLATLQDGSELRCWVYVYNWPLPVHVQLPR